MVKITLITPDNKEKIEVEIVNTTPMSILFSRIEEQFKKHSNSVYSANSHTLTYSYKGYKKTHLLSLGRRFDFELTYLHETNMQKLACSTK